MKKLVAIAFASCLLSHLTIAARGQTTFGNVGTLTCTADASGEAGHFNLLCQFASLNGVDGSFEGEMIMEGPGALLTNPTRRVLVWSVLSQAKLDLSALEGPYQTETAGKADAVLVGGRNLSLRLMPITAGSQSGPSEAPKTLSLKMTATKT